MDRSARIGTSTDDVRRRNMAAAIAYFSAMRPMKERR